jgi:hypothetical protein
MFSNNVITPQAASTLLSTASLHADQDQFERAMQYANQALTMAHSQKIF